MSKRRVVVTGLGTINPLGNNVEDTGELVNGVWNRFDNFFDEVIFL